MYIGRLQWVLAACLVITACGGDPKPPTAGDATADAAVDVAEDAPRSDSGFDADEPDVPAAADATESDGGEDVDATESDGGEDVDATGSDADGGGDAAVPDVDEDATDEDVSFNSVDVPSDAGPSCAEDADCAAVLNPGPCQMASCDEETGACVLVATEAGMACDDGDACTVGDRCTSEGSCLGEAIVCDDDDTCTDDACDPETGVCVHTEVSCDDGNPCTIDGCEPGQGCSHVWDVDAPECVEEGHCADGLDNDGDGLTDCADDECEGADGCCSSEQDCQVEGSCTAFVCHPSSRRCEAAGPVACDDGNLCTADSCEEGVGCVFTPVQPCGVAVPYTTAFDCDASDWTVEVVEGSVTWAIDALPDPPGFRSAACSLNFNDDATGYGSAGGASYAHATSPVIDATAVGTLYLGFWQYWDTQDDPGTDWDRRGLLISTDGFKTSVELGPKHAPGNQGQWFHSVYDLTAFAGKTFQLRFWFDSVDDWANAGAGWFIDDLTLTLNEPTSSDTTESCDNGVDDDGDGLVDCADPSCIGDAACPEALLCDDGLDNDGDGLRDCADPDCAGAEGCCASDAECDDGDPCTADVCTAENRCVYGPPSCSDGDPCTADSCDPVEGCKNDPIATCSAVYVNAFDCGDTDFVTQVLNGSVSWKVDANPAPPAFHSPGCSLNFNNDGGNYGSVGGASSAIATSPVIDLTGVKVAWLGLWQYWQTSDKPTSNHDKRGIRVSSDGFETYVELPQSHTLANEATWFHTAFDLSQFAGQKIQIRFWFDTVDAFGNLGAGWFVDDLVVSVQQPSATPEVCDDGMDNDGDGLVDCADPGCALAPNCPEAGHCDDGVDNDVDGLVDCLDPDCYGAPSCCATDADCDDGSVCTSHSCSAEGRCVLVETLICNDGDPCTIDSCDPVSGCQNIPLPTCSTLYSTAFSCDGGDEDWSMAIQHGSLAFKVDGLPNPPGYSSPACSLNFNDDVGGYASAGNARSAATARTPLIDATGAAGLWLGFMQYWDTQDGPDTKYDRRGVRVTIDGGQSWVDLPQTHLTDVNRKRWFFTSFDVSEFAGHEVQFEFWFDTMDSFSNAGAGWFIDDLVVSEHQPMGPNGQFEICDDGVDNDDDGAMDCQDPDCRFFPSCDESTQCTDGIDNDLNGLTDCMDPACSGAVGCCSSAADCDDGNPCTNDLCSAQHTCETQQVECPSDGDACTVESCDPFQGCVSDPIGMCAVLYQTNFACDETGWTAQVLEGVVTWAIDGTPSTPGHLSPACSLNFNLDTGGYGSPDGPSTAHVTSPVVDATGFTSIYLGFAQYWQTTDRPHSGYDQRGIQVSNDGFTTWTPIDPEHQSSNASKWFYSTFDLSEFAGTQFQVRFWFDSVDEIANAGAGWFIDDLTIATHPPESPL